MDLNAQLRDMEGVVPHAYQDSLGFWTIGVGRLIDERKGGRLTDEEINFLLDNDIAEKRMQLAKALPWTASLDPIRRDALVNLTFQLGIGGLMGFTNSLAAVRDGHYEHAAELFKQSRWYQQTPKRAARVIAQISQGTWQ